ncbi:hypothetical protein Hanom_Chr00s000001g01597481 [Helianthus anomalus]
MFWIRKGVDEEDDFYKRGFAPTCFRLGLGGTRFCSDGRNIAGVIGTSSEKKTF